MKTQALFPLTLSVVLALSLFFVSLPLVLAYVCFFVAAISGLVALCLLTAPASFPSRAKPTYTITALPQQVLLREGLPAVPRTIREVLATMNPTEFEIFSAAVVIAMGQGHIFDRHCGHSGDQGVDALLRNMYGFRVAIQSKLYSPDNTVSSEEVRTFAGSILYYQAAYGFFITTSRFSADAQQVIRANSAIHAIDGQQLETYLQRRSREVALAWADVLDQVGRTGVA